jgi:hypothetical protein
MVKSNCEAGRCEVSHISFMSFFGSHNVRFRVLEHLNRTDLILIGQNFEVLVPLRDIVCLWKASTSFVR